MLGSTPIVAFVATTDFDLAKAFYGDALGLELTAEDGFALVFNANGTSLRVSKVQQVTPAPYTVLGWKVPDIHGAISRLKERGVVFEVFDGLDQDVDAVWTAPGGTQVVWFKDPDNNILSLSTDAS